MHVKLGIRIIRRMHNVILFMVEKSILIIDLQMRVLSRDVGFGRNELVCSVFDEINAYVL